MSALSERHEAAILRTLRDIECGHITLRCSVRYFDVMTGERLAEPELEWAATNREPAVGYPRFYRPSGQAWRIGYSLGLGTCGWWDLLAERGWIRLPTEREPSCWQVTDEGRRVLAEARLADATAWADQIDNPSNDKE